MSARRASAQVAIATAARALAKEPLRIAFVGGTVTALYPLSVGMDVRPTVDVDGVVELATMSGYYALVERLRALGFSECRDEKVPLCRLV